MWAISSASKERETRDAHQSFPIHPVGLKGNSHIILSPSLFYISKPRKEEKGRKQYLRAKGGVVGLELTTNRRQKENAHSPHIPPSASSSSSFLLSQFPSSPVSFFFTQILLNLRLFSVGPLLICLNAFAPLDHITPTNLIRNANGSNSKTKLRWIHTLYRSSYGSESRSYMKPVKRL